MNSHDDNLSTTDDALTPYASPPAAASEVTPQPWVATHPIHTRGTISAEQWRAALLSLTSTSKAEVSAHAFLLLILAIAGAYAGLLVGWWGTIVIYSLLGYSSWSLWRRRNSALARANSIIDQYGHCVWTRIVDESGIQTHNEGAMCHQSWANFVRYHRDRERDMLVLFSAQTIEIFSRTHFATEQDWRLFQRYIARYMFKAI